MRFFGGGEFPPGAAPQGGFAGGPQGGQPGGLQGGSQGGQPGGPQGGPPGGPQQGGQGGPQGGQARPGRGQVFPGGQGDPGGSAGRRGPENFMGGPGGLLGGTKASAEATAALRKDADRYTWAAAAVGAQTAASYQLASGEPVMPVGGFNGTDPSPTLATFQEYVRTGKIHYFIGENDTMGGEGPMMRGGPGGSHGQSIASWVKANYKAVTVGGATFYDLTAPLSATPTSSIPS